MCISDLFLGCTGFFKRVHLLLFTLIWGRLNRLNLFDLQPGPKLLHYRLLLRLGSLTGEIPEDTLDEVIIILLRFLCIDKHLLKYVIGVSKVLEGFEFHVQWWKLTLVVIVFID
jgi:hypothetical protein